MILHFHLQDGNGMDGFRLQDDGLRYPSGLQTHSYLSVNDIDISTD